MAFVLGIIWYYLWCCCVFIVTEVTGTDVLVQRRLPGNGLKLEIITRQRTTNIDKNCNFKLSIYVLLLPFENQCTTALFLSRKVNQLRNYFHILLLSI